MRACRRPAGQARRRGRQGAARLALVGAQARVQARALLAAVLALRARGLGLLRALAGARARVQLLHLARLAALGQVRLPNHRLRLGARRVQADLPRPARAARERAALPCLPSRPATGRACATQTRLRLRQDRRGRCGAAPPAGARAWPQGGARTGGPRAPRAPGGRAAGPRRPGSADQAGRRARRGPRAPRPRAPRGEGRVGVRVGPARAPAGACACAAWPRPPS